MTGAIPARLRSGGRRFVNTFSIESLGEETDGLSHAHTYRLPNGRCYRSQRHGMASRNASVAQHKRVFRGFVLDEGRRLQLAFTDIAGSPDFKLSRDNGGDRKLLASQCRLLSGKRARRYFA